MQQTYVKVLEVGVLGSDRNARISRSMQGVVRRKRCICAEIVLHVNACKYRSRVVRRGRFV
ncbi:hypothetical protein GCM10008915_45460 [Bifidobacterium pullorum subsp. gallinarum]